MQVLKNQDVVWRESGVEGILRGTLWNSGQDVAAELCRMRAGSEYPEHQHAAWEQMLVIEGSINVDGITLAAGDYAFTVPGESHRVVAEQDALVFLSFGKSLKG